MKMETMIVLAALAFIAYNAWGKASASSAGPSGPCYSGLTTNYGGRQYQCNAAGQWIDIGPAA